jgi:hypothetical protein
MRTILDYNPSSQFISKNENWDYYNDKKKRYENLRTSIAKGNIDNLNKRQIEYPILWIKGEFIIMEVQADYYQCENDYGDKSHGYCTTFYFKSKPTPEGDLLKVVNGTHPRNLGYQLQNINF